MMDEHFEDPTTVETPLGRRCQSTPATREAERKRVPEMEASYRAETARQREREAH